jgi:hypothetical protein
VVLGGVLSLVDVLGVLATGLLIDRVARLVDPLFDLSLFCEAISLALSVRSPIPMGLLSVGLSKPYARPRPW